MNRNYHLECNPPPKPPKTSFVLHLTNKYTRSYYKSSSSSTHYLYQGHGCQGIQKHINPNFRIPRAKK